MSQIIGRATVGVVGGGIAGMATAARLQAAGVTSIVTEAHTVVGGCASYYKTKQGFSFDCGATTLVDFEDYGVGGELLRTIGAPTIPGEVLPGYVGWLPDRTVKLYRDRAKWSEERLSQLGSSTAHTKLWDLFDHVSDVFWEATRKGIKMPMQNLSDVLHNCRTVPVRHWILTKYLNSTMGDVLKKFGLYNDLPLKGLLGCLIEDTTNSNIDDAPFINAALGISIRGAGLIRSFGGMYGFWKVFEEHYKNIGGTLHLKCNTRKISGSNGNFVLHTNKGDIETQFVVCAIPPTLAAKLNPDIEKNLTPYLTRPNKFGGGIVVFLGVPEQEVQQQEFTHHQLLQDYHLPQGNGNNMFISVSSRGDTLSAPENHRAVMISTHCELDTWQTKNFTMQQYYEKKQQIGDKLVKLARRVYPDLGKSALVYEIGTPRTYQKFTKRPLGEVGGVKLSLANSNQNAIPHNIGVPGVYLVGDGVWPGLGTVACVLGSRIVADELLSKIL